jgi:hypothetical protein
MQFFLIAKYIIQYKVRTFMTIELLLFIITRLGYVILLLFRTLWEQCAKHGEMQDE